MKIGIIALGLIGGSILKSLYKEDLDITVVSQNNETLEKAKKYTANVSKNIEDLKNSELIFVCTPINNTLETLDKLENIIDKNCIVTDVSSVKEFVMKKERPYKFIGSHPMAGTEFSGFDASFKELFKGAKWVITPLKNTPLEDIQKLEQIIKLTGANTIISDASEHDEAVAMISHMPMLIAQALHLGACKNDLALKLASSGYRDMTRLALSNTTMAKDMLDFNKKNIANTLKILNQSTKTLLKENYQELIEKIKSNREKMYSDDGKNLIN